MTSFSITVVSDVADKDCTLIVA